MKPDDVFTMQQQWRKLAVRGESPFVQFFADYSPESWWHNRYFPSQNEASLQTAFISKSGFGAQINLALVETMARVAVFHRRTVTHKVYEQVVGNFPRVRPVFIVSGATSASRNPTLPLPEWVKMVRACAMERCVLAVEDESQKDELQQLGAIDVRYFPPMVSLPTSLRVEGKSSSSEFRVLLSSESFPYLDLLRVLMALRRWSDSDDYPDNRNMKLILSLGEGPNSQQENFREGLVSAAYELFGEQGVDVWPWTLRRKFLMQIARDVDVVIDPAHRSTVAIEAELLQIPTYAYLDGDIVPSPSWGVDERKKFDERKSARRIFWRSFK